MADAGTPEDALLAMARKAFAAPFGAKLSLLPDEGGGIWVDGVVSPPAVSAQTPEGAVADCTWRGSRETLQRVLDGERALLSAYVAGRIRIAGDMSVMVRLELGPAK